MSEPERFISSKGLKADLLASAKGDRPPPGARRKVLVATAAAVAAGTTATTASATTLGTLVRVAAWKWVAMGAIGVGTVVAARTVVLPVLTTEMSRAHAVAADVPPSAARARPLPGVAPQPEAPAIPTATATGTPTGTPTATPTPTATGTPTSTATSTATPTSIPTVASTTLPSTKPTITPAKPESAARSEAQDPLPSSVAHASPGPKLSAEIEAIDQMKAALASGDAAEALRLSDAYRSVYPAGRLAAEASALRVQALARAGRREEASAELARLKAEHPDSPLLDILGRTLGP